jgi:predicted HD phosphohydrolase
MATASSSETAAAAAAMQADIGDARRTFITQAPDVDDRFHDQHDEEVLQARRNPNPKHTRVLNAWNCKCHCLP